MRTVLTVVFALTLCSAALGQTQQQSTARDTAFTESIDTGPAQSETSDKKADASTSQIAALGARSPMGDPMWLGTGDGFYFEGGLALAAGDVAYFTGTNARSMGNTYKNMGDMYWAAGNYASAAMAYSLAISYYNTAQTKFAEANPLYDSALDNFMDAQEAYNNG